MLKISHDIPSVGARAVIRLEGQILGHWVAELRRVYEEQCRDASGPLTIDLRDVTFIDREGIALFDEIYPHVVLINCSLFAAEQLKTVMARHEEVRR